MHWDALNGVDGYVIYRKELESTEWEKVCVLTDDTAACYEDDSMECGVWYTYSIAIIVSGVEGDFDKSEKFSACKENAYSCSIREKMK